MQFVHKIQIRELFLPLDIRLVQPSKQEIDEVASIVGLPTYKVFKFCYDERVKNRETCRKTDEHGLVTTEEIFDLATELNIDYTSIAMDYARIVSPKSSRIVVPCSTNPYSFSKILNPISLHSYRTIMLKSSQEIQ